MERITREGVTSQDVIIYNPYYQTCSQSYKIRKLVSFKWYCRIRVLTASDSAERLDVLYIIIFVAPYSRRLFINFWSFQHNVFKFLSSYPTLAKILFPLLCAHIYCFYKRIPLRSYTSLQNITADPQWVGVRGQLKYSRYKWNWHLSNFGIPLTTYTVPMHCRSQWPRGLRHEKSSLARTLGSWVQTPHKAWMFVCVYSMFVLSCVGSGLTMGWSPVQGVLPTV
jgi:hypothetical protein